MIGCHRDGGVELKETEGEAKKERAHLSGTGDANVLFRDSVAVTEEKKGN